MAPAQAQSAAGIRPSRNTAVGHQGTPESRQSCIHMLHAIGAVSMHSIAAALLHLV